MPDYKSDEYADQVAVPPEMLQPNQAHGRLRVAHFSYGAATGNALTTVANDTLSLAQLPAGDIRILRFCAKRTAFAVGTTLDVGLSSYKNMAGADVAAAPAALFAALAMDATTDIDKLVDIRVKTKTQLTLTGILKVGAGTAEELNGYIEYVVD